MTWQCMKIVEVKYMQESLLSPKEFAIEKFLENAEHVQVRFYMIPIHEGSMISKISKPAKSYQSHKSCFEESLCIISLILI